MVEWDFPVQSFKEIVAVHADDAFASAKGRLARHRADEQTARPSSLLLNLAVKGMDFGDRPLLGPDISLRRGMFAGKVYLSGRFKGVICDIPEEIYGSFENEMS